MRRSRLHGFDEFSLLFGVFFAGQGLVPLRRRRFFRVAPDAGRGLAVLYGSCRRADSRRDRPLFRIRRRQRPSAKSDMPARGGCGVRRLVREWRFSPVFVVVDWYPFWGPRKVPCNRYDATVCLGYYNLLL